MKRIKDCGKLLFLLMSLILAVGLALSMGGAASGCEAPGCDQPDAKNDSATTYVNTPVKIKVLQNDTDPNGHELWVINVGDPFHGNLVVNEDNTITYTPNEGYIGSDSFEYTISDCSSESSGAYALLSTERNVGSPCCNTDTATVTVTVKQKEGPGPLYCGLLAIEVRPASASIAVGETQEFHTWAIYDICDEVDATAEVTWESGNESIATVSSSGVATGKDIGETTITATLTLPNNDELNASATLTVTAPAPTPELTPTTSPTPGPTPTTEPTPEPTPTTSPTPPVVNVPRIEVTPGPEVSIGVGDTQPFVAIYYYDNSSKDVTDEATWSSDTDAVSIDSGGVATGENEGDAQITASYSDVTSAPVLVHVTTTAAVPSVPWSMIGWIIAAALAAGLLFFFLMRRRKKGESEEDAA